VKAKPLLFSIALFSATIYAAQEAEQKNQNPENSVQVRAPKARNRRGQHESIITQNELGPIPRYDHEGTYLFSVLYTREESGGRIYLKPSISF
jgi:hypothetical protein